MPDSPQVTAPEFPHLSHHRTGPDQALALKSASKCFPVPAKAHLKCLIAQNKGKIGSQPRKVSPLVRVFSRLDSPMGFLSPKCAKKSGADAVPKALTLTQAHSGSAFSWLPGDRTVSGPAKPHLWLNPLLGVVPEPAHVMSRSPSPRSPNLITRASRNISPRLP